MNALAEKVNKSIKVIKMLSAGADGQPIEVSYSGSKDSDVILRLTQMSGVPYRAIYKNTTIDPPGTIAHCKANGVDIIKPKKTFLKIIEEKGRPSRWSRFCCEVLKEYKIEDYSVQGIRRDESTARAKRYKEPIVCRNYSKNEHVNVALPILDWTLEDVKAFVESEKIQLAPRYYDEDGVCHYERRLGCIGCPMKSDKGKSDYREYPKLFRLVHRAVQRFLDNHPKSNSAMMFANASEALYCQLFLDTFEEFRDPQLFNRPDYKAFLEDYFKIEL